MMIRENMTAVSNTKGTAFVATLLFTLCVSQVCAQKQTAYFKVEEQKGQAIKYVFKNGNGRITARLDSAVYEKCYTVRFSHFAIVTFKNRKGFWAIDRHKKLLFRVFDKSNNGLYPDTLGGGLIRITDTSGKIGFANAEGLVVAKPIYDYATAVYKSTAIVGRNCKPEAVGEYKATDGTTGAIYETTCRQAGFIDSKGKLRWWGKYTIKELQMKW
jgi:hypothetical protein